MTARIVVVLLLLPMVGACSERGTGPVLAPVAGGSLTPMMIGELEAEARSDPRLLAMTDGQTVETFGTFPWRVGPELVGAAFIFEFAIPVSRTGEWQSVRCQDSVVVHFDASWDNVAAVTVHVADGAGVVGFSPRRAKNLGNGAPVNVGGTEHRETVDLLTGDTFGSPRACPPGRQDD